MVLANERSFALTVGKRREARANGMKIASVMKPKAMKKMVIV